MLRQEQPDGVFREPCGALKRRLLALESGNGENSFAAWTWWWRDDCRRVPRETLLGNAEALTHVLSDPPPRVVFMEFGDSSLNFGLRVFTGAADNFVLGVDEINDAIDAAFREAGIEIAFPQRDLHVRSVSAGLALPAK